MQGRPGFRVVQVHPEEFFESAQPRVQRRPAQVALPGQGRFVAAGLEVLAKQLQYPPPPRASACRTPSSSDSANCWARGSLRSRASSPRRRTWVAR